MNLASNLSTSARIYPDRAAVRLGDAVTTYTELDERSALVAGLLSRRGLRPGDRVGIMLPNIPDFAALYYGVLRAGGVVVPLNPMLKAREVAYYLSDSGAAVMFGSEANTAEARAGADRAGANVITVGADLDAELTGGAAVRGVVDRSGSDTAVVLYTSGTTGRPEGRRTHPRQPRPQRGGVRRISAARSTADDVIFGGLPLFHSFGQTCTLNVRSPRARA